MRMYLALRRRLSLIILFVMERRLDGFDLQWLIGDFKSLGGHFRFDWLCYSFHHYLTAVLTFISFAYCSGLVSMQKRSLHHP